MGPTTAPTYRKLKVIREFKLDIIILAGERERISRGKVRENPRLQAELPVVGESPASLHAHEHRLGLQIHRGTCQQLGALHIVER